MNPHVLGLWVRGLMAINVDANSASEVQFPACARSQMLTLGKLANLNHSLKTMASSWTSDALLRRSPSSVYI